MQISKPDKSYDVIVVGAGLVGASFCCALEKSLGQKSLSILVIEAIAPQAELAEQSSFDARSTALSFGSREFFEEIELWQDLENAVAKIDEIQVSDRGHLGSVRINKEEQNIDALGYVVENKSLGEVLNNRLQQSARINLLCPAAVSSAKATEQGMQLNLLFDDQELAVDTALLVLADGGKSPVCKQLGVAQTIERYDQHALIANIIFELPQRNIAFERFTENGPLAVLPLPSIDGKNRGSLVWTLSAQQAVEYKQLADDQLLLILQQQFGFKLGQLQAIGERFVYPLSLSVAKEQVRPGLALLGNVAHTLHPVAGQGLNLALRDAQALADAICGAVQRGNGVGQMRTLLAYVESQQADQAQTTQFTHGITKLFSSNSEAKVWLRKFGLLAIDLFPRLRRSLAERAMGLRKRA
jgi:2-octaprenyl-6-methoxyphenol hydroxylase